MSTRRQQEMERGRQIAERARRADDLSRYKACCKVGVMNALKGHAYWHPQGCVDIFYVDGVEVAHQNEIDDDFPSETVMATIALAVGATVGFEGIPSAESGIDPADRARRNLYREHLGAWREHYDKATS